jgi:crotonobetainyl-CoA:carnitine CoA-transferase CaiB-like acyl-CoA transferase
MPFDLLKGLRILDLSTGIPGAYATKLMADAGADVVKREEPPGDPLRRWSMLGSGGQGAGALFEYLHAGKRSVGARADVAKLAAGADALFHNGQLTLVEIDAFRRDHAHLVVVSISDYGLRGPWAGRPATEFTMQAECGSMLNRGHPEHPPVAAGGRIGEWITGVYAAISALATIRAARRWGTGDHVDVSIFEAMCNTLGAHGPISQTMNPGPLPAPRRCVHWPSIEPTADGYVGFALVSANQISDFFRMIGHPEFADDPDLATFRGRVARRDEILPVVQEWTRSQSTKDVVELAAAFRIPVAPVGRPDTVSTFDHFVERGVFAPSPSGRFVQPRSPYLVDRQESRPSAGAPHPFEHDGQVDWPPRAVAAGGGDPKLPLSDIRVVDITAFWAGPMATNLLALLGAEVIHVESIQRPDGFRLTFPGNLPSVERWWEAAPGFHAANTNKRDLTLDLNTVRGRELLLRLVEKSDALVENYTPRVMDNFEISWEWVHKANPSAIMMRMPGFGLDGPWRDRPGFAQTMEQASGMAWITGHPDGDPVLPNGVGDPIAGLHACFALLAALVDRDRTGVSHFIESTMVESVLNVSAELLIEHTAGGASMQRTGNRGPLAAPQGVYECKDREEWVAVAITDDAQWSALRSVLGNPAWMLDPQLESEGGRRLRHVEIDAHLGHWVRQQHAASIASELSAAGVPAARLVDRADLLDHPQLIARGALERLETFEVGQQQMLAPPFRFDSNPTAWASKAAPTLGSDNDAILSELLLLSHEEIFQLYEAQVVGTKPLGIDS